MASSQATFQRRLLRVLSRSALRFVKPKIPSRTLRSAAVARLLSDRHADIHIPHFWAIYVHDGRRPFTMPAGKVMVWFKNPKDDPRLRDGKLPVRRKQLRKLTRDEFFELLDRNRQAIAEGREPPVVIARAIKKDTLPRPFFSNRSGGGMHGFVTVAAIEARPLVMGRMRELIGEDLLDIQMTATLKLPGW